MSSNWSGEVFAAYKDEYFIETAVWKRIEQILAHKRGGNYALAGPRGAGKTWIMHKSCQAAAREDGLGVWFPSPTEYDAKAFLAQLTDNTAQAYIDYYVASRGDDSEIGYKQRSRRSWNIATGGGLLGVPMIMLGAYQNLSGLNLSSSPFVRAILNPLTISGSILCIASFIYYFMTVGPKSRSRIRRHDPAQILYAQAVDLRLRARFTAALKEAHEGSASATFKGLSGAFKRSQETALAERQETISSLTHSLRSFLQKIAVQLSGPVVIAIDELDKMTSSTDVSQLLRDVKGVFDIHGVHFLVSISDEAALSLELAGISDRNEFHSSFYQVLRVPMLDESACVALLSKRGVTLEVAQVSALTTLSGGVARELVRMADTLKDNGTNESRPAIAVVSRELRVLEYELSVFFLSTIQPLALVRLVQDAQSWVALADSFDHETLWNPKLMPPDWSEQSKRAWRRMVMRCAVAIALQQPESERISVTLLQTIVRQADISPEVAKATLDRLIQGPMHLPLKPSGSSPARNPIPMVVPARVGETIQGP
jgi:hypothetical protein